MIDVNTFLSREHFHGAKGLIYFGEKILVFRRDPHVANFPNMMDLPGGAREDDETLFETFQREVREEFGFELKKDDIIFCKSYPSVLDPSVQAYFFVAEPKNMTEDDIVFGDEGLYFDLMTPEEFVRLPDGVKRQQERAAEYIGFKK